MAASRSSHFYSAFHHHHHHQSLNHEGHWGTTDDFTTSFLLFSFFFPFSTALWDLVNSRPVHSLMLSSLLFLCQPCLLPWGVRWWIQQFRPWYCWFIVKIKLSEQVSETGLQDSVKIAFSIGIDNLRYSGDTSNVSFTDCWKIVIESYLSKSNRVFSVVF